MIDVVTDQTYQLKEIDLIDPSPLNPRKTFDQARLADLCASIKSAGVIEPLVVRPGKKDRVELVAGERRWRAAKMAGLTDLPIVVRSLTDGQVLTLMAIENEQRDDIHPLERAVGYQSLMKVDPLFTPETIAARIGKSKRWVQLCLQYLTLVPEAQQAFREGQITAGHADLLVRLGPAEQGRALTACFEELSLIALPEEEQEAIDDARDAGLERPSKKGKKAPMVEIPQRLRSVRELGDWIDTHIKADPKELSLEFPELQDALVEADTDDRKVVEISHLTRNELNKAQYSYDTKTADGKSFEAEREAARALRKVIFAPNWKLADGSKGTTPKDGYGGGMKDSPTCDHSALGVVTFGHGKGQQFAVCVAKQKCRVHWPAPEKRGSAGGGSSVDWAERDRKAAEQRKQNEALYQRVYPLVVDAVRKKLPRALDRATFEFLMGHNGAKGTKPADYVPALVLDRFREHNGFWALRNLTDDAKRFGVDVAVIQKSVASAAAPKPAAQKKPTAKPAAAKKRVKLGKGKK